MPTKIRLQRHGKKGSPYFHIVVADSRAKRDGKFIERIGSYNPNTNPATIELDNDKALDWLTKGAQPSDTARAILSYRGIMYKKHLMRGVSKGALTIEDAEAKFESWISEKAQKIADKTSKIQASADEIASKALAAETAVKEERAKKIMAKQSALAGEAAPEAPAEEVPAAEVGDAPAAEASEAPATEAPVEEAPAAEAPAEEPKAEAPAEEAPADKPAEEPKAEEPKAEAPAEEPKAEEGSPEQSSEDKGSGEGEK